MAQYDVHRPDVGDAPLLLDCQSDLLDHLNSRLVVPLVPGVPLSSSIPWLHPVLQVDGVALTMATHLAAAVPVSELGPAVAALAPEEYAIGRALDVLIGGL